MTHTKRASSHHFQWWLHLSSSQRFTFITIIFIVAIAIPLTLWSALNEVHMNPRATESGTYPDSNTHTPTLQTGSILNPLKCQVGQPCTATFQGSDNDLQDVLTLNIDFLPPPLTQQTCQSNQTLNQTTITCGLSGTPTHPGQYLILVTLTDKVGHTTQKSLTLNIK